MPDQSLRHTLYNEIMTGVENSAERSLSLLKEVYAICRLDKNTTIPEWALRGEFFSVSRTPDELSIVCEQDSVPPGIDYESDWRCLKIESPFEFDLTGMISSVAVSLAEEQVDMFVVATQDSDYILVRQTDLDKSVSLLMQSGYRVDSSR